MHLTDKQRAIADGMAALKTQMAALAALMHAEPSLQPPAPTPVIPSASAPALSVQERNARDVDIAHAAIMYAINSVDGLHVRVTSNTAERKIVIELLECDFNV